MPLRILQVVTYMGRGGLETMLMNCYRHIDRSVVQFDFLVHRDFRADYDDEIESLGGIIHRLPRLNPVSPSYHKALLTFFGQHPEYRIVHAHLDCMSAFPLTAAKKCGVPVRIAHSHNASQDKNWKYLLKRYYMRRIPSVATHLFACSESAGRWMFPGQQVTVVKNGIETQSFAFDPAVRNEVRRELGLNHELTLGHVGRFAPQKNHDFLMEIFAQVHRRNPEAVLLLVGEGPLEQQIREKAERLGLAEKVRFLGIRTDVNRLLQAVDVFVMPSRYEGLGIAAVEAQTAGVTCVLSDGVPECCKLTEHVKFLSLRDTPGKWADLILQKSETQRVSRQSEVVAAGYDIKHTARWLQSFYLEKMKHV